MPANNNQNYNLALVALEKLRERLLDLSKRNTLINYRSTAKTLHIIDELPNEVFSNLVLGNREMMLIPINEKEIKKSIKEQPVTPDSSWLPDEIPGLKTNVAEEQGRFIREKVRQMYAADRFADIAELYGSDSLIDTYAREYASALVSHVNKHKLETPSKVTTLCTSLEIPADNGGKRESRHVDNLLQTNFDADVLERRCKAIAGDAKTALEETGNNLLYLAIGFLEWRADDNSEIFHKAPLILIPIAMDKKSLDTKSGCYRYGVSFTDEGIDTNLSLALMLEKSFGMVLPTLAQNVEGDSMTPEAYLSAVEELVALRDGWSIKRQIVIGFFSFAKIQVYRDLDRKIWQAVGKDILSHSILPNILVGIGSQPESDCIESLPFGEEYSVDDLPDATPIVLDADSSQHSAIIDVISKGENLVIEGPPGTGKSQTIANIIAAAIGAGKTVLFLAEKKAALDVVKRRLDKVGLGDFCLELHSHKTHKASTYDELRRRRDRNFPAPESNHSSLLRAQELKEIKNHVSNISTKLGQTGRTVFELFAAAQRWRAECGSGFEFHEILSQDTLKISTTEVIAHETFIKDLAAAAAEAPADARGLLSRFLEWHNVDLVAMVPGDEVWFASGFSSIARSLKNLNDYVDGQNFPCDHKALGEDYVELLDVRPDDLGSGLNCDLPNLFLALFDEANRTLCAELISSRESLDRDGERLGRTFVPNLKRETLEPLGLLLASCNSLGHNQRRVDQLASVIEAIDRVVIALDAMVSFKPFYLENSSGALDEIDVAVSVAQLLNARPIAIAGSGLDGLVSDSAPAAISTFEARLQELASHRDKMASHFNLEFAPGKDDLVRIARTLKAGQGSIWIRLGSDFRRVKRELATFASVSINPRAAETVELLLELAKIEQVGEAARAAGVATQPYLGPLFAGEKTNFTEIKDALQWCTKLKQMLRTSQPCRSILRDVGAASELMQTAMFDLAGHLEKVKKEFATCLAQELPLLLKITAISSNLGNQRELLDSVKSLVAQAVIDTSITLEDLSLAVASALRHMAALDALSSGRFDSLTQIDNVTPLSIDITTAREVLKFSETAGIAFVQNSASLGSAWRMVGSQACVDFLIGMHPHLETLSVAVANMGGNLSIRQKVDSRQFSEFWSTLCAAPPKEGMPNEAFVRATTFLGEVLKYTIYLQTVLNYMRLCRRTADVGLPQELNYIVDAISSSVHDADVALAHYRANLYMSQANAAFRSVPGLSSFVRTTHESRIKRFCEYDRMTIKQARKLLANGASIRQVPRGVGHGRRADWTEGALLEHQVNLQRRHAPIRQLVRRAGKALHAYKPCFMMSPLSVAQYLQPGYLEFDLVVMDEASQLRPEDALGGILRGKQLVVVGDPNQLPPTSFFDKLSGDDDDGEGFAIEDAESILDICRSCFKNRRLRWHYRSEHESLIAFSNHSFYDDNLLVFPSPFSKSPEYGVKRHYIENARYKQKKSVNILEAEAVVKAIVRHFIDYPKLTLGVATFNKAQADLISELLEMLCKKDPSIERHIKQLEASDEPFFIKNLENVQGDERDVVFISTTYGPDAESGTVFQRFGPLNSDVGWRRLNVIITRAKKRLEVFTSLRSTQINDSDGKPKSGKAALKNYLEFIETGCIPERGVITDREPDSDFEIDVASALASYGFKVAAQVGVAGFYIDLAVFNPRRPGEFLLGIECDGATYHSAKSTRDRDRLRQEILESKGWQIHRIWSTDWFVNREKELERLFARIETRLAEYPELHVPPVTVAQSESIVVEPIVAVTDFLVTDDKDLRSELLEYRCQNIDPNYKEDGRGILSPAMMDILLQKKPVTNNEFYSTVPITMRQRLNSNQLKTYLPDILEIIEAYA